MCPRISLPLEALTVYEALRQAMMAGTSHPEHTAILRYHGMLKGLLLLITVDVPDNPPLIHPEPVETLQPSGELVRLLANLVLHTHAELTHVY